MAKLIDLPTPHGDVREHYVRLLTVDGNNHGHPSKALFRAWASRAAFKSGNAGVAAPDLTIEFIVQDPDNIWAEAYAAFGAHDPAAHLQPKLGELNAVIVAEEAELKRLQDALPEGEALPDMRFGRLKALQAEQVQLTRAFLGASAFRQAIREARDCLLKGTAPGPEQVTRAIAAPEVAPAAKKKA